MIWMNERASEGASHRASELASQQISERISDVSDVSEGIVEPQGVSSVMVAIK